MRLPLPSITVKRINGARNRPIGRPYSADAEVLMDAEVAGTVAPGARLVVYFAPDDDRGFVDAVKAAVHDRENDLSVLSMSWGHRESEWSKSARDAMNEVFHEAALLGGVTWMWWLAEERRAEADQERNQARNERIEADRQRDQARKERAEALKNFRRAVAAVEKYLTAVSDNPALRKHGLEALRIYTMDPPDLMLLDIWMPEMDGMETLRRVRELAPTAPLDARLLAIRTAPSTVTSIGPKHLTASSSATMDLLAHMIAVSVSRTARPYR